MNENNKFVQGKPDFFSDCQVNKRKDENLGLEAIKLMKPENLHLIKEKEHKLMKVIEEDQNEIEMGIYIEEIDDDEQQVCGNISSQKVAKGKFKFK